MADALLMKFCRCTKCMHGSSIITTNMHLHAHLRQCIADYGPLHEFWAFPFERCNGLFGDLPNKKKSIEVQMNRFIQGNSYILQSMPDTFLELKQHIPTYRKEAGSLLETLSTPSNDTLAQSYPKGFHDHCLNCNMHVVLSSCFTRQLFTPEDVLMLRELYYKLYCMRSIS